MAKKQTIETFQIRFDTKNAEKVKKALKGIEKELTDVKKTTKGAGDEVVKTSKRWRIATGGMRRQIGALRNNLLLVTFATEGLRRAVMSFAKTSANFEKMEISLISMKGSVEEASVAFNNFVDLAARTPFNVESVVQAGLTLEAFGAHAEPLLPMMGDLAVLMNTDMPEAAAAFGRAFAAGRGAADVFREKGLLALIDEFAKLNKLRTDTLPHFRVAMVEAFSDPDGKIQGAIDLLEGTLFQSFSNMSDAATRLKDRIGDALKPAIMSIVKALTTLMNWLDGANRSFQNFIVTIKAAGAALGIYIAVQLAAVVISLGAAGVATGSLSIAISALTATWMAFNSVLTYFRALSLSTVLGLIGASIAGVVFATNNWILEEEELNDVLESTAETLEEYKELLKEQALEWDALELAKSQAENEIELQKELDILNAITPVLKAQIELGRELSQREINLIKLIELKKEGVKKEIATEKDKERILKTIAKLEEENQVHMLVAGEILAMQGEEILRGYKKGGEERLKIQKILSKKFLDIALIDLEMNKRLADAALIDEKDRSAAIEVIRKNAANQKEMIEQESEEKINEIHKESKETRDKIREQELQDIQAFNDLVKDSYMQMFEDIASQLKTNLDSRVRQELKALKKTEKYREADAEGRQDLENDLKNRYASRQLAIFRGQQLLNIAQMYMTMNKAILEIQAMIATDAMAKDPTAVARGNTLIKALRVSTAIQSGLVAAQPAPTFATGGSFITDGPQQIIVGDNFGGKELVEITPLAHLNAGINALQMNAIEEQKPAFALQMAAIEEQKPAFETGGSFLAHGPQQILNPGGRERVDITPISSPNIDGPQEASISINIMGNVIGTEEFVRDTLLPEIDNTIKRNLA